jgi:hypothetical protein
MTHRSSLVTAQTADTQSMLGMPGVVGPRNRANLIGGAPHATGSEAMTEFGGILLTALASGIFVVNVDVVATSSDGASLQWQINSYTNATPTSKIVLPANAQAVGLNCYIDNSGAGIGPSSGAATRGVVAVQPITSGDTNYAFNWSGQVGYGPTTGNNLAPTPVPYGQNFYLTVSLQVNDSEIGYGFTGGLVLSAYELP